MDKYSAGTLVGADCVGRDGIAAIRIKEDKKGEYPDSNKVAAYKAATADSPKPPADKFEEADIPF
jgi:hypothetical protein